MKFRPATRKDFNVQSVCAKPSSRGLSSFSRGYNVTGGRCARDRNERDKRKAKKSRVNLLCAESVPAFSHFYKLNPCPWPYLEPRLAIIVAIIVIEYRVSDRYSNDTSPHISKRKRIFNNIYSRIIVQKHDSYLRSKENYEINKMIRF